MPHPRSRLFIALATLAVCAAPLVADVLTRTDGTRLEGDVRREGANWVVTDAKGKRTVVPADKVEGIEFSAKPSPGKSAGDPPGTTPGSNPAASPAAAEDGLASLRRSAESATDPRRVIERYKRFLELFRGTPAADLAAADLATWEDRLARGLIKHGSRWVEPGELVALRLRATEQARGAVTALDQSRLAEAERSISEALDTDPFNAAAQYLRGVLLYRQDKLVDARRAFDAANTASPNHGPTLNNLAATAFRLNQFAPGLTAYDNAMLVMPLERGLLSNVAEALEVVPENQRNSPLYRRVKRRYDEQSVQLAQRFAVMPPPAGPLFPWGATWITKAQSDEIKAAEIKQREEVARLNDQAIALSQQATQLDGQIAANTADLRRMEGDSLRFDTNGNVVRIPLPQIYYTLRSQTDALRAQRSGLEAQRVELNTRIRDLQRAAPAGLPKFTGIQQLYAAAAGPDLAVPPPSRMPAVPPEVSPPEVSQPEASPSEVSPPASRPSELEVPATAPSTVPSTAPSTAPSPPPATQP